jgi:hypothetical protein
MGRAIAAITSAIAISMLAGDALAASSAPPIQPGDVAKYDLSIELQVHVAPAPHTTQAPMSMDTSVLGTETITGLRSDPDGSVHASVNVALTSSGASQSQNVRQTLYVKIQPDGSMDVEGGGSAEIAQYMKTISDASKLYRDRVLHVGDSFSQITNVPGIMPITVVSHMKVVAAQRYRGYPTFAIQSTGSGKIDNVIQGMHATGTFNVAGTTYVDQKDKLFIGEAVRSNVDATIAGASGNRINAVATINLVLDSLTHGKPKQVPTAAPAAAPSPTPAVTPTPTPTPVDQYYTPTPPAPTPSPVVNPYPPLSS